LKRGEIWTVAGGNDYAGKPRPAVIVSDEAYDRTDSVTICGFTTDPAHAPQFRVPVEPSPENGLREVSRVMGDKITSVHKSKMGRRIGRLDEADLARLDQALLVYLGLAASPRRRASI
jgi:mRNA interferase MazF